MHYQIKISTYDQYKSGIQAVRTRVFIQEQRIDPSLEWDEHDEEAIFAIAVNQDNQVIGTARLLSAGKIGRMAVLPNYRRQGVGTALLQHLLDIARARGDSQITLSAQQRVAELYTKQGFVPIGPPHIEVGIPHQNMQIIF